MITGASVVVLFVVIFSIFIYLNAENLELVKNSSFILPIFVALACIVVIIIINITISRPMKSVLKYSTEIAQGNLSYNFEGKIEEIERKDEIGLMLKNLNRIMDFLKPNITMIKISSETLSHSSKDMTTATDRVNNSNTAITSNISLLVKNAVTMKDNLFENINSSKDFQVNLQEKLNQILAIFELMERISKQINMLALNASIEAARAGEYGRGFSVVAENIQKLADETAKNIGISREQINQIKTYLIDTTEELVMNLESLNTVSEVNAMTSEKSMTALTEQGSSMEELRILAEGLLSMSDNLDLMVQKFKIRDE